MTTTTNPEFSFAITGERELTISRVFDAPRELVFLAYSTAEHQQAWVGPRYLKNRDFEVDFRVGGHYRWVQEGPDGAVYTFTGEILELTPLERIVQTFEWDGMPGHIVTDAATFEDLGGRTRLTIHSTFQSAEDLQGMAQSGMEGGVREGYERLDEHLAAMGVPPAGDNAFRLTREFAAPRDLVWKAWTEVERLAQWWGPKGMEVQIHSLDLRPGGICHYSMKVPNATMYGKFHYQRIDPTERLVWLNSFADEHAATVPVPFEQDWPQEMLCIVTLLECDGKTTVCLRGNAYNATPAQQQVYFENHQSMQQGWGGTMEQLEAYLAQAQA